MNNHYKRVVKPKEAGPGVTGLLQQSILGLRVGPLSTKIGVRAQLQILLTVTTADNHNPLYITRPNRRDNRHVHLHV